jgi:maleamate amidohydrolase
VDTVIITGCATSGCIRATVVDALQYGFRPIIPAECVGDRSAEAHEFSLFEMNAKYGDVVSRVEVEKYLKNL